MRPLPAVRFPIGRRAASGGTIAIIGILLLGIPLYDIRDDWDTRHVTKVAKSTAAGWVTATVLFGWVVYVQLRVMQQPT
ncbi:MAG: hypothetical protein ABEJ78_03085 [Haloferacaceae archaeon]